MTRIHKRPGTKAWEKALRRSASRMARDLLRAPEGKRRALMGKYLRNKTSLQRRAIAKEKMMGKARERREKEIEKLKVEYLHLIDQFYDTHKGLTGLLGRAIEKDRYDKKARERMRSSLELVLDDMRKMIKKGKELEKMLPKGKTQIIKTWRITLELARLEVAATIAFLDRDIAGMS